MFKDLTKIACASVLAMPLLACAAPEPRAAVEMVYDRDVREAPIEQQYPSGCPIRVVAAEDARQNKETIGQSINGALLSGDMSKWVTDGLADLKSYGMSVQVTKDLSPPQDDSLLIKASLTRAYTWQIGLKIFSMVALKAQFINKNGVVQEKYYRAHGDKSNMWGAESEYVTTLNYGINNLLPALAKDLGPLCKGTQVEQYTYAGPEPVAKK